MKVGNLPGPVIKTDCRVVGSFCLCSGGRDSTVTAHRVRDHYSELVFIDTGTALPGVVEFIQEFADWLDKPLRIYSAGDAYRTMVLGSDEWWEWQKTTGLSVVDAIRHQSKYRIRGIGNAPQGFPGPGGGHKVAYARLKERQIRRLLREVKEPHTRMARVALITGARKYESWRRMRTQGDEGFRLEKATLWINPLNFWTTEEVRDYHREHEIPQSDVAALLHRSGECNCGSFLRKGEREDLKTLFPDWWADVIQPLEDEAKRRGIPRHIFGERIDSARPGALGANDPGLLCSSCQPQ